MPVMTIRDTLQVKIIRLYILALLIFQFSISDLLKAQPSNILARIQVTENTGLVRDLTYIETDIQIPAQSIEYIFAKDADTGSRIPCQVHRLGTKAEENIFLLK